MQVPPHPQLGSNSSAPQPGLERDWWFQTHEWRWNQVVAVGLRVGPVLASLEMIDRVVDRLRLSPIRW